MTAPGRYRSDAKWPHVIDRFLSSGDAAHVVECDTRAEALRARAGLLAFTRRHGHPVKVLLRGSAVVLRGGDPVPRLAPNDPRHGRYNTYVNWGCRCAACTDANARHCATYRAKRDGDAA